MLIQVDDDGTVSQREKVPAPGSAPFFTPLSPAAAFVLKQNQSLQGVKTAGTQATDSYALMTWLEISDR